MLTILDCLHGRFKFRLLLTVKEIIEIILKKPDITGIDLMFLNS